MSKTQRDRMSKILIIVGILMIMCPIMIRVGNSIITARKISTFQKDVNERKIFTLNIKENIPERYIGYAISNKHLPSFSTKKLIEIITNKLDN